MDVCDEAWVLFCCEGRPRPLLYRHDWAGESLRSTVTRGLHGAHERGLRVTKALMTERDYAALLVELSQSGRLILSEPVIDGEKTTALVLYGPGGPVSVVRA